MDSPLGLLQKSGAILDGHFVGTSGKHLSSYINKDALYVDTHLMSYLCRSIAERHFSYSVDAVVAPALGGLVLSQWVAYHLTELSGKQVMALFTEKDGAGGQEFRRGHDVRARGARILVVDDIATTGGSFQKVLATVKDAGGIPVAAACLVNRNPQNVTSLMFGIPFFALINFPLESYEPTALPDWLARIPVNTTVGHGGK